MSAETITSIIRRAGRLRPGRRLSAARTDSVAHPRPTATSIPLTPVWEGNIAVVLQQRCADCYGGIAGLDVSTYASAMKGGSTGPLVAPGDPDNSLIVIKQSKKHPGQLSEFELSVPFVILCI